MTSENPITETVLFEAPKERPVLSYEEWKEQKPDRIKFVDYFSKDEQGVYWYHMKIIGADTSTFDTDDNWYAHDKENIYYQGYKRDGFNGVYIIFGADVETFEALGNMYAKDKNHAYFKGEEIAGADPETFIGLGPRDVVYAKDKNAVYREHKKIEGFEPNSFRIADKSSRRAIYLVDNQKVGLEVWFSDDQVGTQEINGADPATFEIVNGWWTKDKDRVFYKDQVLENANPETFTVLGKWEGEYIDKLVYAKDKTNVYFLEKRISGADAASFQEVVDVQLLFGAYGKDINNAYRGAVLFPKNDLAFLQKGLLPPSAKNLGAHYYIYQEKVYYYFSGGHEPPFLGDVYAYSSPEQTVYADTSSFKVIKDKYARDDQNVYFENHLLTHDPSKSFTTLQYPYSKNAHDVYYEATIIDLADPASFTPIPDSNYSKDKNFVYYSNYSDVKKIGADLSTFQLVPGGERDYGKDVAHVFFRGKEVRGAAPDSFKIVGKGLSSYLGYGDAPEYFTYAKDMKSVFCEGEILVNADVETFVLKGKNGMPQDKFHHYDGCEAME